MPMRLGGYGSAGREGWQLLCTRWYLFQEEVVEASGRAGPAEEATVSREWEVPGDQICL